MEKSKKEERMLDIINMVDTFNICNDLESVYIKGDNQIFKKISNIS